MEDRLRPVSDSSRKSPSSPGKRRMVDNEKGKIRLISRGLPDSDEEDQQQQVIINPPQVANVPPKESRVLNLSASRKRKTVEPITGEQKVLVLPSPTTQIALQIDSIRLAGTPVHGSTTNRFLGMETASTTTGHHQYVGTYTKNQSSSETMDMSVVRSNKRYHDHGISSRENIIKPTSPHCVPPVASNIEVTDDSTVMERYMQRPQHALNMKRTINEQMDEDNNDDMDTATTRKEKMIKYTHVSTSGSNSSDSTNPIKISTIVQSVSSPTREQTTNTLSPPPSKDKHNKHSHYSNSPSPVTALTTTVSSSPSSSSSQPQSKISNFSITDLLAKDTNRSKSPKPITQSFPAIPQSIPPSYLALYYQQWYMQMLSNMNRFQGETAEADSGSVKIKPPSSTSPLQIVPEKIPHVNNSSSSNSSSSPVRSVTSPSNTSHSPYSVISNSAHKTVSPDRENENSNSDKDINEGHSQPFARNGDLGEKKGENEEEGTDQRQNALLQVSEAHLAILPDEDGDTPLHLSIIQENIPLTFYLIRLICGVRMNLDIANNLRQTPLHLSVITRQPMLTQLLVQNGASVNFPDRRGNTCVHLAAQRKNVDTLQILSRSSNPIPDFNCRNFAGLTPVHLATKEGSVDVLKFLFQMGANKNCADSCSGRTPLHYAVESQNFQMCNFLLENGCNVNAITFSGNTPLHVAAGRRLKEIVAVLMAYGANPAIANGEGDFPSDLPASLLMQRAKMNTR